MYSRYIPRPGGGYDRRIVPDPPAEPGSPDPPPRPASPVGAGVPDDPPQRTPSPLPRPAPPPPRPAPPPRPPTRPPGPINGPPLAGPGGLLGPDGLLGRLLPRGLDTEDLLILAVLLLAMKQDGANPMELLLAVGLYFWL